MGTQSNIFEETLTKGNNIEPDETKKKSVTRKRLYYREPRNYAEKMLDVLSWLFLVLGCIVFIGCLVAWFIIHNNGGDFSLEMILYGFIGCVFSIQNFAIMQVIRNISIKLDLFNS